VIKYLGSKRRLVPAISAIADAYGASTALDLFTGTTRVAQALKALGVHTTAVDTARYAEVFATTYIATDSRAVDMNALTAALDHLSAEPDVDGYFTEVFCRQARFFTPANGRRIDAIRGAIDRDFVDSAIRPLLLTSLIEAADRVDSTTGVQMAYLKSWAARALQPLELRTPVLLPGEGRAFRGDACDVVRTAPAVDLAYLDPPYNQHRYFTNYHVWETLVADDEPEHYGVACKRTDARELDTRTAFDSRRTIADALARCVQEVDAAVVVISTSNEGWLPVEEVVSMARGRGHVAVLGFESKRYVGAQIGVHNPAGERVGSVSHLHNTEHLIVCGDRVDVERALSGDVPASARAG
jgi:adenine-specific DNA-methyltransferase